MALVELRDIRRSYGTPEAPFEILHGISLDVARGELLAIMGTSGSGKSTLMHILGLLDSPTSGAYRLDGQDVSRLDKNALAELRNREIGFVFQGFNLLARTSAADNVEVPLIYRGVPKIERRSRALAALERVGLADRATHKPNQLSGGQQQRVAIARALVGEPHIIFADEPTGNLDSRTSVEVMGLFQALHRAGQTIVLVTHEPDVASFAARTVTIHDGRIVGDERHAQALAEVA